MRFEQGIAGDGSIGVVAEEELLLEDHATDAVSRRRYDVHIILSDVLVAFGAEDVAFVFVYPDVEGDAMLDDGQIKARE